MELVTKYKSNGEDIELSKSIVSRLLTKGDSNLLTPEEISNFIAICKFNHLNPFIKECYLIKYGQKEAEMVTSKEALFKRASQSPDFKGVQAGVIVYNEKNGEYKELEGSFVPFGFKIVGGWAKVYRANFDYPVVSRVNLSEYDKGKSTWNSMRGTMISKVAKCQALREAFPNLIGGIYVEEEAILLKNTNYSNENAKTSEVIDLSKYGEDTDNVVEQKEEANEVTAEEVKATKNVAVAEKNEDDEINSENGKIPF